MAPLWAGRVSGPSRRPKLGKWGGSRRGNATLSEHYQGALEQGSTYGGQLTHSDTSHSMTVCLQHVHVICMYIVCNKQEFPLRVLSRLLLPLPYNLHVFFSFSSKSADSTIYIHQIHACLCCSGRDLTLVKTTMCASILQ